MCLRRLWLEIDVPLTTHRRALNLDEDCHHRYDLVSRAAATPPALPCTTARASCSPSPWPRPSSDHFLELGEDHHHRFDLESCAVMPPPMPPYTGAHTLCPLSPWSPCLSVVGCRHHSPICDGMEIEQESKASTAEQ
jgi:hypothetical protein